MSPGSDLADWLDDDDTVALRTARRSGSLVVPAGCRCWVLEEGGEPPPAGSHRVLRAGEEVAAPWRVLLVRTDPVVVRQTVPVHTSEPLAADVGLVIEVDLPEDLHDDLAAGPMAGESRLTGAAVAAEIDGAVADAVRTACADLPADDLCPPGGPGRTAVADAALAGARRRLFGTGLAPASARVAAVVCPAWERLAERRTRAAEHRELERLRREREEARSRARRAREREDMAETMAQAEAVAAITDDPDARARLVELWITRRMDPAHAAARLGGPAAVCAAGAVLTAGELLVYDPERPGQPPTARHALRDAGLGGLRSVTGARTAGGAVFLVGARGGVHVVPAEAGADDAGAVLHLPDAERLRRGVNRACVTGGMVAATHGELGLVLWDLDDPDAPADIVLPVGRGRWSDVGSVRCVTPLRDGRLALAVDDRVVVLDPFAGGDRLRVLPGSAAGDSITALTAGETPGRLYAGTRKGRVLRLEADGDAPVREVVRRDGTVTDLSVAWIHGIAHLLIAGGRGGLPARSCADDVEVRLAADGPVHWIAAAGRCVFGADRGGAALYLWRTDRPDARAARHALPDEVRDVAALSRPVPEPPAEEEP